MTVYEIPVPRDIEADLVASLQQAGIRAGTIVPAERGEGTVRVSRTGGTDDGYDGQRDTADVLIEVWEADSVTAYETAQRAYAALLAVAARGTLASGEPVYRVSTAPPRAYDDPQTPNLYRVTFTATLSTTLETITITLEENHG